MMNWPRFCHKPTMVATCWLVSVRLACVHQLHQLIHPVHSRNAVLFNRLKKYNCWLDNYMLLSEFVDLMLKGELRNNWYRKGNFTTAEGTGAAE